MTRKFLFLETGVLISRMSVGVSSCTICESSNIECPLNILECWVLYAGWASHSCSLTADLWTVRQQKLQLSHHIFWLCCQKWTSTHVYDGVVGNVQWAAGSTTLSSSTSSTCRPPPAAAVSANICTCKPVSTVVDISVVADEAGSWRACASDVGGKQRQQSGGCDDRCQRSNDVQEAEGTSV